MPKKLVAKSKRRKRLEKTQEDKPANLEPETAPILRYTIGTSARYYNETPKGASTPKNLKDTTNTTTQREQSNDYNTTQIQPQTKQNILNLVYHYNYDYNDTFL